MSLVKRFTATRHLACESTETLHDTVGVSISAATHTHTRTPSCSIIEVFVRFSSSQCWGHTWWLRGTRESHVSSPGLPRPFVSGLFRVRNC